MSPEDPEDGFAELLSHMLVIGLKIVGLGQSQVFK
jgi:hypothetical protein